MKGRPNQNLSVSIARLVSFELKSTVDPGGASHWSKSRVRCFGAKSCESISLHAETEEAAAACCGCCCCCCCCCSPAGEADSLDGSFLFSDLPVALAPVPLALALVVLLVLVRNRALPSSPSPLPSLSLSWPNRPPFVESQNGIQFFCVRCFLSSRTPSRQLRRTRKSESATARNCDSCHMDACCITEPLRTTEGGPVPVPVFVPSAVA
jgi:hypothetical protein